MTRFLFFPILLAAVAGCGQTSSASQTPDLSVARIDSSAPADLLTVDTSLPPDLTAPACRQTPTSNLNGVTIRFPETSCTFTLAQAAAGIQIPYEVAVTSDVTGVIPASQDAGRCGRPGPSGLIVFERLAGGGQNYCICDSGRCLPPSNTPVTIAKGTYSSMFNWDGKNWNGPSDTGNPKGAPFPVGDYDLSVSATGQVAVGMAGTPFEVKTIFSIHLVP